jgi:hypothetical protein
VVCHDRTRWRAAPRLNRPGRDRGPIPNNRLGSRLQSVCGGIDALNVETTEWRLDRFAAQFEYAVTKQNTTLRRCA